jgi:murein DD-endopeptidase MepM/ murein hydrolase activator NlpD
MNSNNITNLKIASRQEFMNTWFVKGTDPDGNKMPKIEQGGANDSYDKYLVSKISQRLNPRPNQNTEGLQTKSSSRSQIPYIWHTKEDDSVRLSHQSKDGMIFNWNSADVKPGQDFNCRCYGELLDSNGNPSGIYCKVKWQNTGLKDKDGKDIYQQQNLLDPNPQNLMSGEHKLNNPRITTPYAQIDKLHPKPHRGVDIGGVARGTPIRAANDGVVTRSGLQKENNIKHGFGNRVSIKDPKTGQEHFYGHMDGSPTVKFGAEVKKGDVIGYVGSSGSSTGDHLHYEVRDENGKSVAPPKENVDYLTNSLSNPY